MPRLRTVQPAEAWFADKATGDDAVLCIGDTLRDCGYPPSAHYASGIRMTPWPLLAQWLSEGMRDARIFSAAVSSNFDCIDIAQLLHRAGFTGQYRVVAPDMPNPELIRREVLAMCPGLDFAIEPCIPASFIRAC